ncbi:MAG: response regulator transcription factor [Actinobacteria bacterium]|nr:response regulator transcription factor [Actinomycetota bacterium]
MIRALIVDDQELVRAGLSKLLGYEDDIEIVGECRDGSEVVEAVRSLRPDVVLMDVRMKEVDGAAATGLLQELEDPPPVLVLTTFGEPEVVAAALGAGARGFILKDTPADDLASAIRCVADGGAWLDPQVTPAVLETYRSSGLPRAAEARQLRELTAREREVLARIGRGRSNQEIAAELYITEATVKSHISNILSKLGARDRSAAIVLAFDHGLVQPGQDR